MLRTCLTVAAVALAAGCSSEERVPAPTPVGGQVLHKGKPVAEAAVTFHPMGGLPPSYVFTAVTDADGRFQMSTRRAADGIPPGEYAVTVVLREKRRDGDEDVRNGRNLLPKKYADPETSGLWASVKPGDNALPPFALAD